MQGAQTRGWVDQYSAARLLCCFGRKEGQGGMPARTPLSPLGVPPGIAVLAEGLHAVQQRWKVAGGVRSKIEARKIGAAYS